MQNFFFRQELVQIHLNLNPVQLNRKIKSIVESELPRIREAMLKKLTSLNNQSKWLPIIPLGLSYMWFKNKEKERLLQRCEHLEIGLRELQ